MPDWSSFVRERLGALRVSPARETEIVAELAQQIEQAHADAIAGGAGHAEAMRRAETHLGDWGKLAREINAAERPDPAPVERPGGLWGGTSQDIRYALRF